jgi:hypothetical protein
VTVPFDKLATTLSLTEKTSARTALALPACFSTQIYKTQRNAEESLTRGFLWLASNDSQCDQQSNNPKWKDDPR